MHIRKSFDTYRPQIARALFVVAAAMVLIGWEVDPVQQSLVDNGVLQLLILGALLDLTIQTSSRPRDTTTVLATRAAVRDLAVVRDAIRDKKKGQAQILALTGVNALPLARDLVNHGWKVQLLVLDPGDPRAANLRAEIQATISRIAALPTFSTAIELRTYNAAPSMHGLILPELAVVGWFNTRNDFDQAPDMIEVHGFPMVAAEKNTPDGAPVWEMFSGEYSKLWSIAN